MVHGGDIRVKQIMDKLAQVRTVKNFAGLKPQVAQAL